MTDAPETPIQPTEPGTPQPTTLVGHATRKGSTHLLNADGVGVDRHHAVTAVALLDAMGKTRTSLEYALHESFHAALVASRLGPVEGILSITRATVDTQVESPRPNGVMTIAVTTPGHPTVIAHVGDTRAYALIDEDLVLLTKDQTYPQLILDNGGSAEEAALCNRNAVTNSLARATEDTILVYETVADRVILVSDGMYRGVEHESMREIVAKHGRDPQRCADALVIAADNANCGDDATAIVLYLLTPARSGDTEATEAR
jgi:protein phosphatase